MNYFSESASNFFRVQITKLRGYSVKLTYEPLRKVCVPSIVMQFINFNKALVALIAVRVHASNVSVFVKSLAGKFTE